jgi:type I restriction enzyme S subunit
MRPYLRVANVYEDRIDLTDVKEMDFTGVFDRYRLTPGDVLLNEGQTPELLGRPAIYRGVPEEIAFTNSLIRFQAGDAVTPEWALTVFRYYMHSGRFKRESRITTNIAHLSATRFKTVEFPVPPLREQRRIVEILEDHLSRLDAGGKVLDAAVDRVNALGRSTMLRALVADEVSAVVSMRGADWGAPEEPTVRLPTGWRWTRWGDIGTSQNGKAFPSKEYQDTGVKLLRPGNMRLGGNLDWSGSSTRRLPLQYADSHLKWMIQPGDLVMNLTAQSLRDDFLGRVCLVREGDEALLNQRIARLQTKAVSADFALTVFRSPLFREYVKSLNTGSMIQHMFTSQIERFWFPLAPSGDQEAVVQKARTVTDASARLRAESSGLRPRLRGMRQAVLAAAFEGKLTGRHTDREVVEEMASV